MPNKVVLELYPGETLFVELELLDDEDTAIDVSAATPSIKAAPTIDPLNVTIDTTDAATGRIGVRVDGDYTANWVIGQHEFQVWLDYGPGEDVEHEVILDAIVTVKRKKTA